jgi:hypothetical protein
VSPQPDIAGFRAAMDNMRAAYGEPVTFHVPVAPVWPAGTPIDEDTGAPFDPTVEPQSGGGFTDVVRSVLVIYHAISPRHIEADQSSEPAGLMRGESAVLDVSVPDWPAVQDATEVTVGTTRYAISDSQDDGILGRDRVLVFLEAK